MDFSQARINYNNEFRGKEVLPKSLCTVDGTFVENISIKDVNGNPNEEYYKWEFIYSLISSGRYRVVIILELRYIFQKVIYIQHR